MVASPWGYLQLSAKTTGDLKENILLLPLFVYMEFPHLVSRTLFWLVAWLAFSVIM